MKSYKKLIQPYVIWISIFLVVPMLLILLYAFTSQGNDVMTFHFTFENFIRFFQDNVFLGVLIDSFRIALITTVICILIGYPAAYLISKMNVKHNGFFILLITLPMWINMLVRTYAWIGILNDNGVINNILSFFGVGKVHMIHTEFAVILGMVYNFLPFMILQIHSSLAKLDKSLLEASSDLGATPFETFKKVIFPLSLPGVISGITLVFLPAVSSFFIPKLLGGGQLLIGNLIENYFVSTGDWNFGSAISLIMALLIMVSMYLTKRLDKNGGDS
ncbi:spermidine/putrescine transport system permease protein [Breznakia sp. PF5-3]|uniref:ABC transporter permease n=1 Tax=unclassified Breznakia TaxID=2623764 RepID=UPI0024076F60|nr:MULTISPECIES: ABC transporter permease [unclassified Breznakia]MDF9825824.1 spermidine/putrescine transport system permease protein [Breznakia sp. PM6-1]MDF9836630.1 spermidine/putrescine transport system permease protein [Breznakia sp. PF5-3]MDF9838802.1 spermidine/putrescine transport system permease protein [Breznakia sp. PFB2-8]MDF9860829.1 spermidine/putrescine transport system permease protein [Breznakia sp. PH5-24]